MPQHATEETVREVIQLALEDLREELSLPALGEIGPETPLLGSGSDMDSMALVHLIAELESRLEEIYGKAWILADERALSRSRSPFRTVGTLAAFIVETEHG